MTTGNVFPIIGAGQPPSVIGFEFSSSEVMILLSHEVEKREVAMTEDVKNSPSTNDLPPAVPEFTGEVTSPPMDARFVTRAKESVDPVITRNLAIRRMFSESEGIFESSFQFSLYNKLPVSETNVRHVHDDVEKIYYFITGSAEIDCGPWRKDVQAGDFLFFPAAIPHQIRNTGSVDLEFIVVAAKTLDTAKGMENGGLIELSTDS